MQNVNEAKKKNDIKTKLLFLILAVIEVHRFFLLF